MSDLSRLELELQVELARARLSELRSSLVDSDEEVTPADTLVVDQVDSLVATLSRSFTAVDDEALRRFNIVQKGVLHLQARPTLREAITASRSVCSDELWSNDRMYKHLARLVESFRNDEERFSRNIVDTFFFRSITMVPPPQKMILMLNNQFAVDHPRLPYTNIMDAFNYTAVVADPSVAEKYLHAPKTITECDGDQTIAFFASAATAVLAPLHRVLLELVALATRLGKTHVRCAVTTGVKWRFAVVELNPDGDGAKYWVSDLIEWKWRVDSTGKPLVEETSDEFDPALITGILSAWIPASFEEFKGDQWFVPRLG